ncbi:hypothetical protein BT93_E2800 [Corymbia citriodora subsp. variegata]|nr:hypothetical protein BT93_E2800 [Corymbia citriodora subsp. variegata]
MAEKVTKMSIKVDLQCSRCYKKIRKILCKFPQIRDRIYDEKQNRVSITVVCCSPEKIQQKIICKGGETVQSVEILPDEDTEKPKTPKKVRFNLPPKGTTETPAPARKPAPPPEAPKPAPQRPLQPALAPLPPKTPKLVMGYPPGYPMMPVYPTVGVCCCPPCYGGYCGGPCYCARRRPQMCYDGCGRPASECPGGNRGSYPGQGRPGMREWM